MSESSSRRVVLHAYKSLSRAYGKARKGRKLDAFEQLILCILAHRATETAAQKAMDLLKKEYVDWNEVRVSPLNVLGETLSKVGIDTGAARALKAGLEAIFNKQYAMNLDFVEDAKPEDARRALRALDSIPDQIIAAAILQIYDSQPVPVDEDVARVVRRLGATKPDAAVSTVEKLLRSIVPKREAYNFFRAFVRHAHKVCQVATPACDTCTVRRICAHGQQVLAEARTQRAAARRASESSKATARTSKKTTSKTAAKSKAARKTTKSNAAARKKTAKKSTSKKTKRSASR